MEKLLTNHKSGRQLTSKTHLSERQLSKRQQVSAAEVVEKKEPMFTVGGNVNCGVATEKKTMQFPYKTVKIKKELQRSNSMSWHLSRDNRNNTLHMPYAYCSIISNSQYKKVT